MRVQLETMRFLCVATVLMASPLCGVTAGAQATVATSPAKAAAPSKFFSAEDGWVDVTSRGRS
jgi:hypothetical protein